MANESRHRALVAEIQRLVQIYPTLPADVKQEVLRFIQTPEMMTSIRLRSARQNGTPNSVPKMINYYVV